MTPATAADVVHHLYRNPGRGTQVMGDLLPACGTVPGPDPETGAWHTGHPLEDLLECLSFDLGVCAVCLSPEVLGGWSPLIMDDEEC